MYWLISILNNGTTKAFIDIANTIGWSMFIGAILYKISGRRLHWRRIALYALITLITIILPGYFFIRFLPGLEVKWSLWGESILYALGLFRNPLWMILCNFLTVHILKIPQQSMKNLSVIIFCAYQIPVCATFFIENIFWYVVASLNIEFSPNSLIFIYYNIFDEIHYTITTLILAVGFLPFYLRIKSDIRDVNNIFMEDPERKQSKNNVRNYVQITTLWVLAASYLFSNNVENVTLYITVRICYSAALIIIHALVIFLNYHLVLRELNSKSLIESNKMMSDTIDSFLGIKHDFDNILQTYNGYFALGDYKGLKQYHEELVGETFTAGYRLSLQATLEKKPAIFGLILNISNYASKQKVSFNFLNLSLINNINIPEFDLCRILHILLNNAIEHGAKTKEKNVSLSIQAQSNSQGIIIISNSADDKINTYSIFNDGFTTKDGHMGHGLAEVGKIAAKYDSCWTMATCTDDTFTMFLYVPFEC